MTNQGRTPEEMVRAIQLPDHLRPHPYLAEVYGTVAGCVRGIYAGYIGWFDGNATNLDPLPSSELATRLLPQLGGRAGVLTLVRGAISTDPRWASWLADLLLATNPRDVEVRGLKATALTTLAKSSSNPLNRHWYYHEAAVLSGTLPATEKMQLNLQSIEAVPIEDILAQIPYRILPDRASGITLTIGYDFPDTGKQFTLFVRRGVAELARFLTASPDLLIRATEHDFKRACVVRVVTPLGREFWRKVKFEVPGGSRLLTPFRALRVLLRLDRCILQV
jgi:alkyl sulfatase BDS1-like metallo-beta-lactamase superfamily hydrolase